MRRPDVEWQDRLEVLRANVFGRVPVLVLLDNFEDNLELRGNGTAAFADIRLGELLAAWLEPPGRSRLLVTCRYPLALPNLADHHLGPLSLSETRKLIWRLEGLDALSAADRQRAYADVGGHPRALEYLDALVRGGAARFPDVAARMERELERKGIADPKAWLAERGGDFDAALAEAVSLAAGDVLLGRLLQGFADLPRAWPLLLGASVYRVPVPEAALVWQVGEVPALPAEGAEGFPEVAAPAGWARAWEGLLAAGLVAPYAVADGGEARFAVHRWTAGKLAAVAEEEELAEAHRRTALFWRWRVAVWPQDRGQDMLDLLEARYHHHAAGDLDEAVRVTEVVCLQFQTWGAYRRQEQLMQETLRWLPEGSAKVAVFMGQFGNLAVLRGDYETATGHYEDVADVFERVGNLLMLAATYHQLGIVAHKRGSDDQALDWYRKSLALREEVGNRDGMADSYHQLGIVAQERGSYDEALNWYRKSLAINEELGNRGNMAISYQQLGSVAQDRGSYDEALDWYRKSLTIKEKLGNRAGMAISYHQLGSVAQDRGSYDEALGWYRKSLAIREELGDRAGMATSTSNLGALATQRGAPEDAVPLNLQSLAIRLEIGSPQARIDLRWLARQRELLGAPRFAELLARHLDEQSAANVLSMLDREPSPPTDGSPEDG